MLSTDENTMRAAFERVTPGCIEKVKKIKDFGFVHFTNREAAEQARAAMHESILEGIQPLVHCVHIVQVLYWR